MRRTGIADDPTAAVASGGAVGGSIARMSERRTSLLAALLVALGPVSMALYTPAMPALVDAFDSSQAAIKSTLTVYFAGFAVAQLLAGPLSDAFGRRKTTIGFLVIYLLGSIVAALAVNVPMLLLARLIQGIGAAVGVTVARAIVRDQFAGERASRIMNMVGIILAVAPAMSPALGGLALTLSGWQAIFALMIGFGVIVSAVVLIAMAETTHAVAALARPPRVLSSYRRVLGNAEFLSASLVVGCSVGALYAQATILPFVLIDEVGLTPTQFGVGMLMQSGFFFLGSLATRYAMGRVPARRLVAPGLVFIGTGSVALIAALALFGATFLTVMVPVALAAVGIAFVMPYMQVAGLRPFPGIAGSASAMMGFIQMGLGLLGGSVSALLGNPVLALGIVVPALSFVGITSYFWYRRLSPPERRPALEAEPTSLAE